jgi:diguanylate cyclase (GGDEF)-like protein
MSAARSNGESLRRSRSCPAPAHDGTSERTNLRSEAETRLLAERNELAQKNSLLEGIIAKMDEAVLAIDVHGKVLICNQAAEHMLQTSNGREADAGPLTPQVSTERTLRLPGSAPLARALRGEVLRQVEELVGEEPGSSGRWLSTNASPLHEENGTICGAFAVSRDVTTQKTIELELHQLSIVDELTGLYNRRGFRALGEQQLKLARRAGTAPALLFIDVDDMKPINDEFGHDVGDRALRDAACLLEQSFRESDIVARFGGDEFVVMAPDASPQAVDLMQRRLYANVDRFHTSAQRPYKLSLSVGVSFCDLTRPGELDDFVAEADQAMYEHKGRRSAKSAQRLRVVESREGERLRNERGSPEIVPAARR